jgi:hypothetical protein
MKEKRSLHLKVQELVDCYATSDPLKEMSVIDKEEDREEAALKWIALTVLHGINANADEIRISRSVDGEVKVSANYRKTKLPSPDADIGNRIIETIREITHIEGDKGKMPLALGIRDGSLELGIKVKRKDDGETIKFKFPE